MDDNTPAYGFERDDISLLMQTSTTFFKAFHNSQESEQSKRGHRCSGGPIAALLCTLLSEIVILWAVTCWVCLLVHEVLKTHLKLAVNLCFCMLLAPIALPHIFFYCSVDRDEMCETFHSS
ncbi:uncharacterized protein [Physcomitrium patens]|uniref:uncharacterized protein isoform X1 n=1 Tax=Physcomitrium patens TaxID=3218 RepID=UPI003CCDA02A